MLRQTSLRIYRPRRRHASLAPLALWLVAISPLAAAPADAEPFDTQIGLDYRLRYQATAARGHGVEGWANNELAIDARLRAEEFVLGLAGFRNKVPLLVAPLAAQPAPQPAVESSRWDVSLGYVVDLDQVALMPRATYTFAYTVPGSSIPWTGTPLDFAQTRQGPGLGVEAAGARGLGPFDLSGRLHAIPSLGTTLSGAPYVVEPVFAAELGLRAGVELFPGLRAGVDVARLWSNGKDQDEWADLVGFGLTYFPGQVRL